MITGGSLAEGKVVIVESREQSTPGSTWTEHLCLHRRTDGKWELYLRTWEAVGFAHEYYNQELDEVIVPDQIDGVDVVGIEDGLVVVATFFDNTHEPPYVFDRFDSPDFRAHFEERWRSVETWRAIEAAIAAYPSEA